MITFFALTLYQGLDKSGTMVYQTKGIEKDIEDNQWFKFPGFDGVISLSLSSVWESALAHKHQYIEQRVYGYETIIKYNNTMQLKEPFTLILEIEYPV